MTTRNVYKQLATMEDLAQGVGQVNQRRGNTDYSLGQVDTPYAVESEAEMSALDVTKFTRARVYSSVVEFTDYIYDESDTNGIPSNTGQGTWVLSVPNISNSTSILFDTINSMTISSFPFAPGNTIEVNSPKSTWIVTSVTTDLPLANGTFARAIKQDLTLDSISTIANYPSQLYTEGSKINWLGYYEPSDGGSNWGIVKVGAHTEDGGSIFSIDANTYIEANLKGKRTNALKFGVKNDGSDTFARIQALTAFAPDMFFPKGEYYVTDKTDLVNQSINGIRWKTVFKKGINMLGIPVFTLDNSDLECLVVDGNRLNLIGYAGRNVLGSNIEFNPTGRCEKVYSHNTESSCFVGAFAKNCKVFKCYAEVWEDHAMYFSSQSENCDVSNLTLGLDGDERNSAIQLRSGNKNIRLKNIHQDVQRFSGFYGTLLTIHNSTIDQGDTEDIFVDNVSGKSDNQLFLYSDFDTSKLINVQIKRVVLEGNGTQPALNFNHRSTTVLENTKISNCKFSGFTDVALASNFATIDRNNTITNNEFFITGGVSISNTENMEFSHNYVEINAPAEQNALSLATSCRGVNILYNKFKQVGAQVNGYAIGATMLQQGGVIINAKGNTFDIRGNVFSGPTPPSNPGFVLGLMNVKDNFEFDTATDNVDAGWTTYLNIVDRFRQSGSSPMTKVNGLV